MSNQLLRLVLQDTFAAYVSPTHTGTVPQNLKNELVKLNVILERMRSESIDVQKRQLSDALILGSFILEELDKDLGGNQMISIEQNEFIQSLYSSLAVLKSYQAIYIETPSVDVILGKLSALNDLAQTDIHTVEQLLNGAGKDGVDFVDKVTRTATAQFSDIKGIDSVVNDIETIVKSIPLYTTAQFILLTGPPGTGKSVLSRAIATEFSNGVFYNLGVGELSSPYVGETEAGIILMFKKLSSSTGNMTVVLDEFDTLFDTSQAHLNSVRTTIQTEIQGAGNPLPKNILLVAITNHTDNIPPPILRRTTQLIYVPPPKLDNAVEYFSTLMGVDSTTQLFNNKMKSLVGSGFALTNSSVTNWYNNARINFINKHDNFEFFDTNTKLIGRQDDIHTPAGPSTAQPKIITLTKDELIQETRPYSIVPSLSDFEETREKIFMLTKAELKTYQAKNQNLTSIPTPQPNQTQGTTQPNQP